jgi:hypothetical protein
MKAAVAQTDRSGAEAGAAIANAVIDQFGGERPDAVIVFATPDQDHGALLRSLYDACSPGTVVGCTSAGEFTSEKAGVGMTCALALRGDDMAFNASVGRGLRQDRQAAAEQMVAGFEGVESAAYRYRSALVLTDALAGFADDLVDQLTVLTGGIYRFFGGGAGDDARFESTVVFCGSEVVKDAAVALEILSDRPIGIGVSHGWAPASERMRVTEAAGMQLFSLNAAPAVDAFDAAAQATSQAFDRAEPIPFFLHNVLGIESADGYRLRVPLAVGDDGSITCAADVPSGATSCIMSTTAAAAADAAAAATRAALAQLEGHEPAVALVFDCVATRLRLGAAFGEELAAVQAELGDVPFAGFNTYGQIAQAEGQFSGFHNCTAVVCVLPR